MNDHQIGRVHRALRHRLGLTQAELSLKSGVQRNKISELEHFDLSRVSVPELDRCFVAMNATVRLAINWNGAALDRLLDEGHAQLAGAIANVLVTLGWLVQFEISFATFGDRGSIDILAWHPATRTLLVVEVKTEIGSVEGLLRPLDVKVRHAGAVAAERFGWKALVISKLVVVPEHRSVRRQVERHAAVLARALPVRNREIRKWLNSPAGPIAGLLFLPSSQLVGAKRNPSAVQRVRTSKRPGGQA